MSRQVVTLPALPPSPPAFDYGKIDPNQAATLRAQAERICKLKRTCTSAVIEIGRELIVVKDRLDHGQFERWIETECGFTRRSADNYMNAAKFAEDKPEIISDLPPALVYHLASKSTPPEIVDEVLHRAANGEVVKEVEIRAQIRETKRQAAKPSLDPVEAKKRVQALAVALKASKQHKKKKRGARFVAPIETQHDRDLKMLLGIWEATCATAQAEFLRIIQKKGFGDDAPSTGPEQHADEAKAEA